MSVRDSPEKQASMGVIGHKIQSNSLSPRGKILRTKEALNTNNTISKSLISIDAAGEREDFSPNVMRVSVTKNDLV
jgi:hypothetical protein